MRDLRADIAMDPDQLHLPAESAGSYRSVLKKLESASD
jgi:hypothetical protein